jgi:DNA-binding CsgD family transcriptional regulator
MHVGIVTCDRRMHLTACTPVARGLLERSWGFRAAAPGIKLPAQLAHAVADLEDRNVATPLPLRVETNAGPVVYVWTVRVHELPPSSLVICMREEVRRDEELHSVLGSRFKLSARNVQIVSLLTRGLSNREIAEELGFTASTVKTYVHQVFELMGVRSRHALMTVVDRIRSRLPGATGC